MKEAITILAVKPLWFLTLDRVFGWPMIDNENGLVNEEERLPDLPRTLYPPMPQWDNFECSTLQLQWNTIHPPVDPFYSLTDRPGYLRLQVRPEVMEEICTPSFIGRRQRHKNFLAKTAMEFAPAADQEEAGIALVQDDRFHYLMTLGQKEEQPVLRKRQIFLRISCSSSFAYNCCR